ncbi:hypothetical protein MCUN1_003689 [Malassezia cuniculi]|uniref:Nuclear pore complex protein Nup85 n=1 Tax=Malassezia cuniculi TaxID=948313 RepID=A0AAF0EYH0_9BASI|nr:hypothetical protein MCUN1_003689 [Malassezia cuniculi]
MADMADDAQGASARVKFYAQTFTVFHSLQSIAASQLHDDGALDGGAPSVQSMQYFSRIGALYSDEIHQYFSALESQGDPVEHLRHIQTLHTIFRLAQVLYFPPDGSGMGVVGEELLHWLNAHDVAPTTEQGHQIAQTSPPHEHPEYWDYVFRCVLRGFYSTAATVLQSYALSSESSTLRALAADTAQLLQSAPRSTAHATEQSFQSAHRSWLASVRALLSSVQHKMDTIQTELRSNDELRLELEAQFRCLLELLAGVPERVLEFSEDWKEAVAAWVTLVQPLLKRDDLPEVVQLVTDRLPVDGTLASENILWALMAGDVPKAVRLAIDHDQWLATHLGDYCDKAGLLEGASAPQDESEGETGSDGQTTLRDSLVFTWARILVDEERLWRMALSYLASVPTASARTRMRGILFNVPLQSGDVAFEQVEEVLSACIEYGMDDEVRIICKRLGHALMEQQKYGLAVAYAVRARDARQIREIADRMLDDYFEHGVDAFVKSVETIPRVLLDDAASVADAAIANTNANANINANMNTNTNTGTAIATASTTDMEDGFAAPRSSIFDAATFAPLAFHVKYCDFFHLFADSHSWAQAAQALYQLMTSAVTPESFLAVLLVDALPILQSDRLYFGVDETYELLRIAEKVAAGADGPDAAHYMSSLERLLHREAAQGAGALAQERLSVVRLALAQYLARVCIAPSIDS